MIMPMFVYINKDPNSATEAHPKEDDIIGMTLDEQGHDD